MSAPWALRLRVASYRVMRCWGCVWGLGFRGLLVQGFRGLGFRACGLGFSAYDLGLRTSVDRSLVVEGSGYAVYGFMPASLVHVFWRGFSKG